LEPLLDLHIGVSRSPRWVKRLEQHRQTGGPVQGHRQTGISLDISTPATFLYGRWQMRLVLMTKTETLLTRLGLWGALQGFPALVAAIIGSVALLISLTPPFARLFTSVTISVFYVVAVGLGLLLGLIGHYAGDFWDRVVFEAYYGPRGWWRDSIHSPLLVFPPGAGLTRERTQTTQALSRKPQIHGEIYREAVKVARRQLERWQQIVHPLILSQFVRGFLWPCLFVSLLAFCAAAVFPFFGTTTEVQSFLLAGASCLVLTLLFLIPYTHLRVEHMIRLYQNVTEHRRKRKPERR
jgi:hypothetical protein